MRTHKSYGAVGLCIALGCGTAMLAACGGDDSGAAKTSTGSAGSTAAGTGTTTTSTGGTTTSGTGGSTAGTDYCMPAYPPAAPVTSAVISDFEGEAGSAVLSTMPGGVWNADVDGTGTAQAEVFKFESCGTTGTGLRFKGGGFSVWGADVAASFVSATQGVDASAYTGISFVLKSATSTPVIFKLQNPDSIPACGKCVELMPAAGTDCYAGYVKNISTNDGTPQIVTWVEAGKALWGYHNPGQGAVDSHNLISIAFAVANTTPMFDICIDDVKFVQ
ncbi:MAG TPA: hypothetical protein VF881_10085 [Polyangiaceae bacterium]